MNYFENNLNHLINTYGKNFTEELLYLNEDNSQFNSLLHEISLEDITGGIQNILPDYMDFTDIKSSTNYWLLITIYPIVIIMVIFFIEKYINNANPKIKGIYSKNITNKLRKIVKDDKIEVNIIQLSNPMVVMPRPGFITISSASFDFFTENEILALCIHGYSDTKDSTSIKIITITQYVLVFISINYFYAMMSMHDQMGGINPLHNFAILIVRTVITILLATLIRANIQKKYFIKSDELVIKYGYGKYLLSAINKYRDYLIDYTCKESKIKNKQECKDYFNNKYDISSIFNSTPAMYERIRYIENKLGIKPSNGDLNIDNAKTILDNLMNIKKQIEKVI